MCSRTVQSVLFGLLNPFSHAHRNVLAVGVRKCEIAFKSFGFFYSLCGDAMLDTFLLSISMFTVANIFDFMLRNELDTTDLYLYVVTRSKHIYQVRTSERAIARAKEKE